MANNNVSENICATKMCMRIYKQRWCVQEYTGNNNAYENIEAAKWCTRINEQPQCVQDYTKNNHVHENIQTTTRYNNKRYVDIRICFTQCGRDQ